MNPMPVIWKRLITRGQTCRRCEDTGRELTAAIAKLVAVDEAPSLVVSTPNRNFRWRIVGNQVERTTDGGKRWRKQDAPMTSPIRAGAAPSAMEIGRTSAVAIGFVVVAIVVGQRVVPPVFARVATLRAAGSLGLVALAFALVMAAAAEAAGSALIIGALAAGLVLHDTPQRHPIESSITALGHFVVPIFFAAVGAMVDLRAFASPATLAVGLVLTAVGVAGKVIAGFVPPRFTGRRLLVGVAMVPRGEVGLIFAQVALVSGAIAAGEFGAIMLMVILTTVVTPPWLAALVRAAPPAGVQTTRSRGPRSPARAPSRPPSPSTARLHWRRAGCCRVSSWHGIR